MFETSLLQHKKLRVISDSEYYNGPVSVLKMITGNDIIPGRKKHVQEGFSILVEGILVIFGNYAMHPKDSSTGFSRQIFFPATNVVPQGQEGNLIFCTAQGEFSGPISTEFSGILNWVMAISAEIAMATMKNTRFPLLLIPRTEEVAALILLPVGLKMNSSQYFY
jgi:phage/plasmid-associated DNA primase